MGNPFDYQRPLTGEGGLVARGAELDALQRAAADRVAVRLVSPRRFGKTSLLRAHLSAMREAGHHAAYVDFDRVATLPDVANRIVDGFRVLPLDAEHHVDERLRRLGLSVGLTGITVHVAPRAPARGPDAEQARAAIRELLTIPGELAVATKDLVVVAFDEFQDLLTADARLDGLFRSVVQHQKGVAYVFAGSAPTLMRALFAERERPFYGQARPLDLPGLPAAETVAFVRGHLPPHSQRNEAAAAVVEIGAGHPQRTMLLAHHLFDRLEDSDDGDLVEAVLVEALAELDDVFHAVWAGLDAGERAVMASLADGVAPAGSIAAARSGKARSSAQRALERLEADGQLVTRGADGPELLDPLLREWLRRR